MKKRLVKKMLKNPEKYSRNQLSKIVNNRRFFRRLRWSFFREKMYIPNSIHEIPIRAVFTLLICVVFISQCSSLSNESIGSPTFCPGPNCLDGTMVYTCCGVGKSDFWHPFHGCDIFCGACREGCRQPRNIDQCQLYCQHAEWTCEEGCTGLQEVCDEACLREQSRCNDDCQRRFP